MSKIKVVHILNSIHCGGIEKIVIDICNGLNKDRFDVTIIVLHDQNVDYINNINTDVKLIFLNIKTKSNSFKNIINLFINLNKIKNAISFSKCEIVHTHTFLYSVLPVYLCVFVLKLRHFHTVHTSGMHYQNGTLNHFIKLKTESFLYRTLKTHLLSVSDSNLKILKSHFKGVQISLVHNGINFKEFINYIDFKKDENVFKFVYLARLDEGKSHKTLLHAFEKISKKRNNLELLFGGDGPLKQELINLTNYLNIGGQVKFLGNVVNIKKLLKESHVGVFPSEFEGFSIALLEMMACGLPIIASDAKTILDMGLNARNSLIFRMKDSDSLAAKMELLLNDKDLLNELSIKSIQFSSRWTIEKSVRSISNIYQFV